MQGQYVQWKWSWIEILELILLIGTPAVQLGTPVALLTKNDRFALLAAWATLVTAALQQRTVLNLVVVTEVDLVLDDYLVDVRYRVQRCYSAIDYGPISELRLKIWY